MTGQDRSRGVTGSCFNTLLWRNLFCGCHEDPRMCHKAGLSMNPAGSRVFSLFFFSSLHLSSKVSHSQSPSCPPYFLFVWGLSRTCFRHDVHLFHTSLSVLKRYIKILGPDPDKSVLLPVTRSNFGKNVTKIHAQNGLT